MNKWKSIDVLVILTMVLALLTLFAAFTIYLKKPGQVCYTINKKRVCETRKQTLESIGLILVSISILVSATLLQITLSANKKNPDQKKPISWSQFLLGMTILLHVAIFVHII